tara:strand:- start:400 stop:804 length:405 start_codon:yes stop_codon:yes gene_type:complete
MVLCVSTLAYKYTDFQQKEAADMKIVLKKLACRDGKRKQAVQYIQDALGRTKNNHGVWHRLHERLKPFQARMCILPHKVGICVYLVAEEAIPIEMVQEARMMIHNRHRLDKLLRTKRIEQNRARKYRSRYNFFL